jgi:hypothetical protein
MSDPNTQEQTPQQANAAEVCGEIGRGLASLWELRDGARPSSVECEYTGNAVRCTIVRGETDAVAEGDGDGDAPDNRLGEHGYAHRARRVVADATGRTVRGFVVGKVSAGDPAKNAFLLEPIRTRN